MSTTDIALIVGLAAILIATQMGSHTLSMRRLALPLVAAVIVGWNYLQTIPTTGGSLDFIYCCTAAGAACGLLAASLVRVHRDAVTGRIMTWAGAGYAAVWVVVLGGRLAFAYLAEHDWSQQVGQFSIDHALTAGSWSAGFILMTLAMVLVRTAAIAVRASLVSQGTSFLRLAAH